jgi:hypothetical protein
VLGIGPQFKIRLSLRNSGQTALLHIPVVLLFDPNAYVIRRSLLTIPIVVPAVNFHTDVDVRASETSSGSREIHIVVCDSNSTMPIITAAVIMPPVES